MLVKYLLITALVVLLPTLILYFTKKYYNHSLLFIFLASLAANRVITELGITIPQELGKIIVTIALIILLFEVFAKVKMKHIDSFYMTSLKISLITFFAASIIITAAITWLYQLENMFVALIAAMIITATSYTYFIVQPKKWFITKINSYLETEAVLTTALAIILCFIFTAVALQLGSDGIGVNKSIIALPYTLFFVKLIVGIGTGIVIGLIISKYCTELLQSRYLFLFLLGVIIATYLLSEALQGSGIVASIIMALFFGNVYIKQKEGHLYFSTIYNNLLYIFLSLMIAFYATMPSDLLFYGKAVVVFILYLMLRLVICLLFMPQDYSIKNRLTIAAIMPKEIEMLIITFFLLLTTTLPAIALIANLHIVIILLSIIVSIISFKVSKVGVKL